MKSKSKIPPSSVELIILRPNKANKATSCERRGKWYVRFDSETAKRIESDLAAIGQTWEEGAARLVKDRMTIGLKPKTFAKPGIETIIPNTLTVSFTLTHPDEILSVLKLAEKRKQTVDNAALWCLIKETWSAVELTSDDYRACGRAAERKLKA